MIIINKHRTQIFNIDNFAYITKLDDLRIPSHRKYKIVGRYNGSENYTDIESYDNEKERDEDFDSIIAYLAQEERVVRL